MTTLELVRDLPDDWGRGRATLYKRGDEYIVVSTVIVGAGVDNPASLALISLGNTASRMMGDLAGEFGTEETMAFRADENGEVETWGSIAVAVGNGSREAVLAELER